MGTAKLYRICTEDVNGPNTRDIVSRHFDGFTLLRGDGVWKGGSEKALVIEIMGEPDGDPAEFCKISALCLDIKAENRQEVVLVEVVEAVNHII